MAITGKDVYEVHYEQQERFIDRMGWDIKPCSWEELPPLIQEQWDQKADEINRKDDDA